jgi:hypothetical protein
MELTADSRYLGAEPGFLLTLHTWGRSLSLHPHLHCPVTDGGLDGTEDWVKPKKSCFLPARVVMVALSGKVSGLLAKGRGEGRSPAPLGLGRPRLPKVPLEAPSHQMERASSSALCAWRGGGQISCPLCARGCPQKPNGQEPGCYEVQDERPDPTGHRREDTPIGSTPMERGSPPRWHSPPRPSCSRRLIGRHDATTCPTCGCPLIARAAFPRKARIRPEHLFPSKPPMPEGKPASLPRLPLRPIGPSPPPAARADGTSPFLVLPCTILTPSTPSFGKRS